MKKMGCSKVSVGLESISSGTEKGVDRGMAEQRGGEAGFCVCERSL